MDMLLCEEQWLGEVTAFFCILAHHLLTRIEKK